MPEKYRCPLLYCLCTIVYNRHRAPSAQRQTDHVKAQEITKTYPRTGLVAGNPGLDGVQPARKAASPANNNPLKIGISMNLTGHESREALIGWAQQVAEVLRKRTDQTAANGILSAVEQFRAAKFQLAVLGKAKRGKSTLINALLGRQDDNLAPIDKLPASSAITKFSWKDKNVASVQYQDGRNEPIDFQQIREFVTEEFNRENAKGVAMVEVAGPFARLDKDLTLIDTPGASSIHEHHDSLLHAFIPQADAVVFLVTARMPIDQDELDLLSKVKAADIQKIFFAINKVDELKGQDLRDAIDHNRRLLMEAGLATPKIHEISAKRAFEGNLTESGLPALAEDIAVFLAINKGRVLKERFVQRVESQAQPVLQSLTVESASFNKTSAELNAELTRLRDEQRSMASERSLAEREFNRSWTLAVDQFDQAVATAKQDVLADLSKKIGDTSVLEVSKLARRLPTILNQSIEDQLARPTQAFEEAAQNACRGLQASYPSLSVSETGAISVRTKAGVSFVAGAAGGLVAAATGAGVAVTGGAIAGGIAAANAAALAATTTVAAPSIISGLLASAPLIHGLPVLQFLAPLATGTATVAAPAALATTPLWVALAGPIGWTLAGVGLMAVPFSWRLSKLKLKDKIDEASQEQIGLVFERLRTERVPALRQMGKSVVEEFQINLDRKLQQIEAAMVTVRDNRPSEAEVQRLGDTVTALRSLLEHPPVEGAAI